MSMFLSIPNISIWILVSDLKMIYLNVSKNLNAVYILRGYMEDT